MPTRRCRTARYASIILLAAASALVLCEPQAVAQQSSTYHLNLSKVDFPPEALINSTFYVSGLLNYSLPPPSSAQSIAASNWFIVARIYNATTSPPTNGTFLATSDTQEVSGAGTVPFTIRLQAAPYQKTMGFTLYAMYQPSPLFSGTQPASGPLPGAWRYTHAPTSNLVIWINSSAMGHIVFSTSNRLQVPVTIDGYLQYQTNPSGQLLLNVTGLQWHIITIPSTISLAPGQRAVFLYWQDRTNFTTRNVYMDQDKTLIATYKIQFFLTVNKNNGSGWYDNGTIAQLTANRKQSNSAMGLIGFEPIFTGWTGDVTTHNSTVLILMNEPHEMTAMWKTEFRPSLLKLAIMIMIAAIAAATLYKVGYTLYTRSKLKHRE